MSHILKRLELNGFKSFAHKTALEFPSGITAIVGPNGSGKSNVVDAIRWLLGERDAKNLRGAKAEDLIFAGTPKRARMGQAQASLHFGNGNKFFPIDAAEVVITRQISRDGTSRYFLNKAEILLRDLVDFFATARLGSRGLIVITQGNSDVFVSSTPEGRREMIEEILGLREYQIKKFDAERRLKNSQANAEKARVLIEEILPHLRSLKRQTSRWEKRGELEEELKILENVFFGTRYARVNADMTDVVARIDSHKEERVSLGKEKDAAARKQKDIEEIQPAERTQMAKIREDIRALLESRGRVEKETARIEARLELIGKSSQTGDRSASKMAHLLEEIRDRLEMALESDPDAIREEIERIIADMNSFFEHNDDKPAHDVSELSAVQKQFDALLKDVEKIKNQLNAFRDEEKSLESRQEKFYSLFKDAVANVEAARKKIEAWENKNREYLFERQRLELRREELIRQMGQAGRTPAEFESEAFQNISHLPQVEDDAERRMFKLRGDLASIGEVDHAIVKEAAETETRYEFLKKESEDIAKAVTDLRGLIRDLSGKIKSEFETAIIKINEEFRSFFDVMFGGGHAKLVIQRRSEANDKRQEQETSGEAERDISDKNNAAEEGAMSEDEGGVEIDIKLPRKKIGSLDALSGGERSLVGIAALFALISVSPPPFLVLDEVDAALDDRNSKRFSDMLKEFSKHTQFVVVTHNRTTMEAANILYGVTLNDDGTSKILSMKFDESSISSAAPISVY